MARNQGNEASPLGRRLILGFDAGCTTCSGLAEEIEDQVGGSLEIRSLRDPQMEHWRERALGSDAPWAPTLVEVDGGDVRAWTGMRMGARLARRLGPAASWRVAKVLGAMSKGAEARPSSRPAITRSRFITGLGGMVAGMSVLSGTGPLAAAATADEHWLSKLSLTSSKELSGREALSSWARFTRGRHLRGFFSSPAASENPAASRLRGGLLTAARSGDDTSSTTATVKGVRHELKGGGRLLALAYHDDEAAIVYYRLDKLGEKTRQLTRVIEDESAETVRVSVEAEDGDIFAALPESSGEGKASRSACGNCGPCYGCRCVSTNKRCAAICCGACIVPCAGNIFSCIVCVGIWCPVCNSLARCCKRKACRYITGC